jgi:hypothetical protein
MYHVTLTFDIDAPTPLHAAEIMRNILIRHEAHELTFAVSGGVVTLPFDDPEASGNSVSERGQ